MGLDNEDIKQLIAILQRGLTKDDSDDDDIVDEPVQPKTKRKTQPKKKQRPNKFEQMPEFKMCKEDVEIDKKIKKPPPSLRKPQFSFVKVQCRVCGKSEEVAPSLIETIERYKCNKCATGAG